MSARKDSRILLQDIGKTVTDAQRVSACISVCMCVCMYMSHFASVSFPRVGSVCVDVDGSQMRQGTGTVCSRNNLGQFDVGTKGVHAKFVE